MSRQRKRCRWVTGCMVDPKANAEYVKGKTIAFTVGQQVWVSGIECKVVSVANGQLTLEPINVKT
jgi:hypothetical protein